MLSEFRKQTELIKRQLREEIKQSKQEFEKRLKILQENNQHMNKEMQKAEETKRNLEVRLLDMEKQNLEIKHDFEQAKKQSKKEYMKEVETITYDIKEKSQLKKRAVDKSQQKIDKNITPNKRDIREDKDRSRMGFQERQQPNPQNKADKRIVGKSPLAFERSDSRVGKNYTQALKETKVQVKEGQRAMNNLLQELASQIKNKHFFHHSASLHMRHYSLTNTGANSIKILRKGQIGLYNFVNGIEILQQQRAKYTIKIIRTAHKSIYIGFCTRAGLGNMDYYLHKQSAYYCCLGDFYEGGVRSDGLAGSNVEDLIECNADLWAGALGWKRNGRKLKQCKVPQRMNGQTVYLSLLMYHAGDQLEVSV